MRHLRCRAVRFALHQLTAAVLQPITAYCGILLWQSSPVDSDYTSKTYGVEVQTAIGFTRLREKNPVNSVNPVQNFPLATAGSKISRIRFDGSGAFRSLVGEWAKKVRAFMIHIR